MLSLEVVVDLCQIRRMYWKRFLISHYHRLAKTSPLSVIFIIICAARLIVRNSDLLVQRRCCTYDILF